ncbi:KpsF/GutQ family sugar-phosphate isomerase [Donghicola eburneus]|uniref:3-hexulose-6-phosphate isomerase n=1 Tax=Donghicola eburneus TaxID=393278 RepID=A0A1M4N3P4_9RHOB|nr:KpsF/GutQ family sugar-phosphate isomerase [Donghicola eburneus]SCM69502.1 3-hexulose-6-phosphate isomerase [Donghicola eburneus]SFQ47433.1 arabinose-5-phosphate isomerase [Donghicola eburneus]
MTENEISQFAQDVLKTELAALSLMADAPPAQIPAVVRLIQASTGRVIVSGMGKSGHVGAKMAATFASTGTPAQFVHPGEASHGDLGMITKNDVVILISNSGETKELADIIAHTRRFGIKMVAITKNADSTLAQQSDYLLQLPNAPEACAIGMAPTTSTTLTMALGDAVAVALMRIRGFEKENFLAFHPGGSLGAQLLPVAALMHKGDELPLVDEETTMGDALVQMSAKGLGIVALTENGKLNGIITDGDLRRNLDGLMEKTAGQVATRGPRTIRETALASEALGIMNDNKITTLCVTTEEGVLRGIIHIHDCLRAGVA